DLGTGPAAGRGAGAEERGRLQVGAREPGNGAGCWAGQRSLGTGLAAGGDEAGGVAGDHELLVGRHYERLDRTGTADPAPGRPAVRGVGFRVLAQAEEAEPGQNQAADDRA